MTCARPFDARLRTPWRGSMRSMKPSLPSAGLIQTRSPGATMWRPSVDRLRNNRRTTQRNWRPSVVSTSEPSRCTRSTRPSRHSRGSTAGISAGSCPPGCCPAVVSSWMMVRRRDRSPLARTRSSPVVASSAKPCSWKPRVQPRCRGGLERFLRRSTRTFFFFFDIPPPFAGVLSQVAVISFRLPSPPLRGRGVRREGVWLRPTPSPPTPLPRSGGEGGRNQCHQVLQFAQLLLVDPVLGDLRCDAATREPADLGAAADVAARLRQRLADVATLHVGRDLLQQFR